MNSSGRPRLATWRTRRPGPHYWGTGSRYPVKTFTDRFRRALKAAGVEGYVRPFHDLRHTSITNGAAAGESPIALMTRAGHANMNTTKRYLHLAGQTFPEGRRPWSGDCWADFLQNLLRT